MNFNIYDYKNFIFNLNPSYYQNTSQDPIIIGTEIELIRKLIDVFYLILDSHNSPNFFNIQFETGLNEEFGYKYLLPNIGEIMEQYKPINLQESETLTHLTNETKLELIQSLSPIFIQCSLLLNLIHKIDQNPQLFGLSYKKFLIIINSEIKEFYNSLVKFEDFILGINNEELKLVSLNQFIIKINLLFEKLRFIYEFVTKLGYYDETYDQLDNILTSINTTLLLNNLTLNYKNYLILGKPMEHELLFKILQNCTQHYLEKLDHLLIHGELIDPMGEVYLDLKNNFNEPIMIKGLDLGINLDLIPLLFKSCSDELIKVSRFKILLNNLKDENFNLNDTNSPINLVQNSSNNNSSAIINSNTNTNRSINLMNRLNLAHKSKVQRLIINQPDCPITLKSSLNQLELDFKNYLNELIIPITSQLKPIILNQLPQLKHLINIYLLNPPFPDELLNHLTQYPPLPSPTLPQLHSYFHPNYYNIKVQLQAPSIPPTMFDEVPTSPIAMFLSTLNISVDLPFPINIIFKTNNLNQLKTLIYMITYCQLALKRKSLKSLPKPVQLFKYQLLLIINQLQNYLKSSLIWSELEKFYGLVGESNLLELNHSWEEIKQNFIGLSFLTKKLKPIFNSIQKLILISIQLNHYIIKFNYSNDLEFDSEDFKKLGVYFNLFEFEIKFLSRTLVQLGDNIQFKLVKELALNLDFGEYLENNK